MLSPSCSIITRENIQIIQVNNKFATAEISIFGAQMLSFKPKHDLRERFWLSANTQLDGVHAIRGGVPVCWPWFGDHEVKQQAPNNKDYPSHGYVRSQVWEIIHTIDKDQTTEIALQPTFSAGPGFNGEAKLCLLINIGRDCSMQLITSNTGKDNFTYRCALHSYFAVNSVKQIRLSGISGSYLDKTQGMQNFKTPEPYTFNAETDRVHLCQATQVKIIEDKIETEIQSSGHDSLVVWNPWQDKSISMNDMENDGYLTMICVETAVTQGQLVEPGKSHTLSQTVY